MICSYCGKECGADLFCTSCGQRVQGGYAPGAFRGYAAPPQPPYYPPQGLLPAEKEKKEFPYWAVIPIIPALVGLFFAAVTKDPLALLGVPTMLAGPVYFIFLIVMAAQKKNVLPYVLSLLVTIVLFIGFVGLIPDEEETDDGLDLPPLAGIHCVAPMPSSLCLS